MHVAVQLRLFLREHDSIAEVRSKRAIGKSIALSSGVDSQQVDHLRLKILTETGFAPQALTRGRNGRQHHGEGKLLVRGPL